MNDLNKKIFYGAGWQFLERISTMGLQLVVTIIMARLIAPKVYGLIALMQVFINLCSPFVDGGFGMALIQRKEIDDLDCSTVFWFNLGMSLLLCAGIWFCAPMIAEFYHEQALIAPLRIFEFMLVISSLTIVHMALLSRNMEFKKNFLVTWGGLITYSMVGIIWALISPSVWALVAATMANAVVRLAVLYSNIRWRPKCIYSWIRFRILFSYSSKLLGNTLLSMLSQNYVSLLIGRCFGSVDIAYFTKGKSYPGMLTMALDGTLTKVMFPVFSKKQDDNKSLVHYCRLSISVSFLLVFPALTLFALVATPTVRLVLTGKWLPCVPFIRIACATCLLWVFSGIVQQCLNGRGNSGVVLVYRCVTMVWSFVVLYVGSRFGIINMLLISLANSYLMFYAFIRILGRYIGIKFSMILFDIWKPLTGGIGAAVFVVILHAVIRSYCDFVQIISSVVVYIAVYVLFLYASRAFQIELILKGIKEIKGRFL